MSESERKPNPTKENEEAIRTVFANAILQEGNVITAASYSPPDMKNNGVYRYFHNGGGQMLSDTLPDPAQGSPGLEFTLDNYIFSEKNPNGTIQRDTSNRDPLQKILNHYRLASVGSSST
jgi:hypothetical protein